MPPRYSYWTILAGGLPTAFRSAEREDLLPTFARLREKHPDAVIRWFARGKLWESPEAARAAVVTRESRGRDWRPGGTHRDPRQPYIDAKKDRNLRARHERFENRQRGDRDKGAPPADRLPDQGTKHGERPLPPKRPVEARDQNDRPKGPPRERSDGKAGWTPRPKWQPRGDAPPWRPAPGGGTRPERPHSSWKPSSRPKPQGANFRPGPRGPRDDARHDDRGPQRRPGEGRDTRPAPPRDDRPTGPRENPHSRGSWVPKPKPAWKRGDDTRGPAPKPGPPRPRGESGKPPGGRPPGAGGTGPKRPTTWNPSRKDSRSPRKGPRK